MHIHLLIFICCFTSHTAKNKQTNKNQGRVRIAAQNRAKEDNFCWSPFYPLQSLFTVQPQAAKGMGIQLSSSAPCFVTRMYNNRVEEQN